MKKEVSKKAALSGIATTVVGGGVVTAMNSGYIEGGILIVIGSAIFAAAEYYGVKNIPFSVEQIRQFADEISDTIAENTEIDEKIGAEDSDDE